MAKPLAKITTRRPYKNGRNPGQKALLERNFQEVLAEKMSVNFPDVVDAMVAMAKGYEEVKVSPDGTINQIKNKPDVQAGKLLFDFTLRKPEQKVTHSGSMGIVHLVAQLNAQDNDDESS